MVVVFAFLNDRSKVQPVVLPIYLFSTNSAFSSANGLLTRPTPRQYRKPVDR
ncbi:hypothetical protein [Spirosoma aerophilum]